MNADGDSGACACPYCGSLEDCEHLLLLVDMGSREVHGGVLRQAFESRCWEARSGKDRIPHGEFERLVEEAEELAERSIAEHFDSEPGSSTLKLLFVPSVARAQGALRAFGAD